VLTLDLELEHLARARQRGFQREAVIRLMLRQAAEQTRELDDEPRQTRRDRLGPAARFLAAFAPRP
jgi:hypothetical protein